MDTYYTLRPQELKCRNYFTLSTILKAQLTSNVSMLKHISLSLDMTTCFHKYTWLGWRTDTGNWTRSVDLSLIRCLFRIVKCKFTEPLYKSARYTLLSLLIFRTHAQSVKWEGRNLTEKKTRKYRGCWGCCIPLRLCSSIVRYCGYRDSPTDTVGHMTMKMTKLVYTDYIHTTHIHTV